MTSTEGQVQNVFPHPEGCIEVDIEWDGYLSCTATLYDTPQPSGDPRHYVIGGYLPPEDWPEHLRPVLKFHMFDQDGPPQYVTSTLYHAGDKDHWGRRPGEVQQCTDQDGVPLWKPVVGRGTIGTIASHGPPAPWRKYGATVPFVPLLRKGEGGKPRDFRMARLSACWPEATDDELINATEDTLVARLPGLMKEFLDVCKDYLPEDVQEEIRRRYP